MMKWKKYCTCFLMSCFMMTVGATSYATMNNLKEVDFEDEKLEVEVIKQAELCKQLEQFENSLQEKQEEESLEDLKKDVEEKLAELKKKGYLDEEDASLEKETKQKSSQKVQTLKQVKTNDGKKRIDINVRGLNEGDEIELLINAGSDEKLCRLKKKQETFYVQGDSKIITLVDKVGQVYQIFQDEDQVEVSIHVDVDGNFQFVDVSVLFQTPYPLSETYQDPASCYLGKDGASQIQLFDEHENIVADCIIHPEEQFYNNMQGKLGWNDHRKPVGLFKGETYRMEYKEKVEPITSGLVEQYETYLDFVYDDKAFQAENHHVIQTGVYPKVNQTLTIEHVNGTPIANEKLCFYHDPLCLEPIVRVDGSLVEYTTDDKGEVQLNGVFDGTSSPTMHPEGYKMVDSKIGKFLDLFEVTTISKDIYVDMPHVNDLEFVDHNLELVNYRIEREEGFYDKIDIQHPTLEHPMKLQMDQAPEIEVPKTADTYNPKGHLRIFTISYFILMFSYVMLKTRRKPRH